MRNLARLTTAQVLGVLEAYQQRLESLLAVDEGVAEIVTALRAAGQLANTLIVFTSDNGFLHGEHRILPDRGKSWVYEASARVPLVMRGPGLRRGARVTDVVSNVDLAPTFLAAAKTPPGRLLDGRSLLPLARDPLANFGRDLLIESSHLAAIRTDRYLYVAPHKGARELYDLQTDPYELRSRHLDPALRDIRYELSQRLGSLGTCFGASCLQDPRLNLRLAPLTGGSVRADVAGADARWVKATRYYVDGKRVAARSRAPFPAVLPPSLFATATATVRVRVHTTDGRSVTITKRMPSAAVAPLVPAAGQPERGVDQPDVRVRLREVARLLERLREDVLGVEAEAVREREQALEELPRLVRAAEQRERLDEPEGADRERRLHLAEVVARRVAAQEAAVDRERVADRVDVRGRARVVGLEEADVHGEQVHGVELRLARDLGQRADLVVPALRLEDLRGALLDLARALGELVRAERLATSTARRAPAQCMSTVKVCSRVALAELPRARVRLLERASICASEPLDGVERRSRRHRADEAHVEEEPADREHHLAVDVVLDVLERLVADAHRLLAVVAGEVVELLLGRVRAPVEAVRRLEHALALLGEVAQVLEEALHLLRVAEPLEGVQREVRVAEPAVAVVPVAPRAGYSGRLVVVAASSAPVSSYWWSLSTSAERMTSAW